MVSGHPGGRLSTLYSAAEPSAKALTVPTQLITRAASSCGAPGATPTRRAAAHRAVKEWSDSWRAVPCTSRIRGRRPLHRPSSLGSLFQRAGFLAAPLFLDAGFSASGCLPNLANNSKSEVSTNHYPGDQPLSHFYADPGPCRRSPGFVPPASQLSLATPHIRGGLPL